MGHRPPLPREAAVFCLPLITVQDFAAHKPEAQVKDLVC
jgi:hypothetical protein